MEWAKRRRLASSPIWPRVVEPSDGRRRRYFFRAAAQSQLKVWSERAQVEIFAPENVKDPGAVAFDAVQMAKARGYDLV